MAIGVFGLKKVYKRQLENINNGNFNSWVEDYSHSYIMGGKTLPSGSPQATLIRFNFIDELSQQLPSASNLPATSGQSNNATIRNYNYAFVSGGSNPGNSTIARLDFSTELFSLPGIYLPFSNTTNHSAVSRADEGYGYFVGGQSTTTPTAVNTITRFDFTNETKSTTVNLPTAITDLGAFNGTTYGYAAGGQTPLITASSIIYRLDFSSGSLSIPASTLNLITGRKQFVTAENNSYGYSAAGRDSSNSDVSTIDKLDFSSETNSRLSVFTSIGGQDGGGYNSLSYGYFSGIKQTTTVDRLDFSNESITSSIGAYMSPQTRGLFSSTNVRHKRYNTDAGTYQYCNGGTSSNKIDKLSFQTGTWNGGVATAPNQQANTKGASSNDYGYFFGGDKGTGQTSEITRLDFTTDNLISLGAKDKTKSLTLVLPSTASLTDQAVTQTNSYAYIVAGNNPSTSAVLRMDFSTENITQEAQLPGGSGNSYMSTKSPINAYFTMGNSTTTCYRLNFSTETVSTAPNYPFANNAGSPGSASSKGPTYGYFLAGQNPLASPTKVSLVYRFDFSSETFGLIPTTFANQGKSGGFSYNNIFAYFNDFDTSNSVKKMDFGTETIISEAPAPNTKTNSAAYTNTNN